MLRTDLEELEAQIEELRAKSGEPSPEREAAMEKFRRYMDLSTLDSARHELIRGFTV